MEPATDICFNPTSKQFRNDLDDVMTRTKACHVNVICASSGMHDLEQTVQLAKKYGQRCTVGVHPHWADRANVQNMLRLIEKYVTSACCVAIGECGLDYNRMRSGKEKQLAVFRAQMRLASTLGKPVLLHSRDAHEDMMRVLREFPDVRGVVHCFTGTEHELKEYLEHGLYVGFTTLICQNGARGRTNRSMLKHVPMDRLMLETDAPYMIPPVTEHDAKLLKPRRNEPWTVQYALKTAAEEYGVTRKELATQLRRNVNDLFLQ